MNYKTPKQPSLGKDRFKRNTHSRIFRVVSIVPCGRVATYGQIAGIVGSSPRQVGYAMAALDSNSNIPWQRIINHRGKISLRKNGKVDDEQYLKLCEEGIVFDSNGTISLSRYGWHGPSMDWLERFSRILS